MIKKLKWLYPGMGVKRWIILSASGVVLLIIGSMMCVYRELSAFGLCFIFFGIIILILAVRRMMKTVINVFLPQQEKELVDLVYHQMQLRRGPKVVVIGGGTGLSVLLQGLKRYTSNITAIVTVADDGGSSGRLRTELDVLPPGDIRNCLVALADKEKLMQDLFQFRFPEDTQLAGHNFGNLYITAMTKLTGDFEKAVKESSKVLAISGQVVPATLKRVSLVARYEDGSEVVGESQINKTDKRIQTVYLKPLDCEPTQDALDAIAQAEAIVLGPGSLYSSVIPNLTIRKIQAAILEAKAVRVYVCNVMTQDGETHGYTASDHVRAIVEHTDPKIIDYVIVNKASIAAEFLEKYRAENAYPVQADIVLIKKMGYMVIEDDVVSTVDYVRHNSDKLALIVNNLLVELKYKGI
ncbi:MAG: gluconeogenesis factor YvcK family protein [Candidatus Omnitrophota bacterium]